MPVRLFAGRAPQSLDEALRLRVSRTSLCGNDVHILLRPAAPLDAGQGSLNHKRSRASSRGKAK